MAFVNDLTNTSTFSTEGLVDTQVYNFTNDQPLQYLAIDGIPSDTLLHFGDKNEMSLSYVNRKSEFTLGSTQYESMFTITQDGTTEFNIPTLSKERDFFTIKSDEMNFSLNSLGYLSMNNMSSLPDSGQRAIGWYNDILYMRS